MRRCRTRLRWRAVRAGKRSTSDESGVPATLPCFPYRLQNGLDSQRLSCGRLLASCVARDTECLRIIETRDSQIPCARGASACYPCTYDAAPLGGSRPFTIRTTLRGRIPSYLICISTLVQLDLCGSMALNCHSRLR